MGIEYFSKVYSDLVRVFDLSGQKRDEPILQQHFQTRIPDLEVAKPRMPSDILKTKLHNS